MKVWRLERMHQPADVEHEVPPRHLLAEAVPSPRQRHLDVRPMEAGGISPPLVSHGDVQDECGVAPAPRSLMREDLDIDSR